MFNEIPRIRNVCVCVCVRERQRERERNTWEMSESACLGCCVNFTFINYT